MKNYHALMGALLISTLPSLAQTETKNGLPYPIVTPEEAVRLAQMKTIALHIRDMTVKDALGEVEKQTGVPIETTFGAPPDVLDKKISLDIETTSFKEATDAIFAKAGAKATLRRFGNSNRWNIYGGEDLEQSNKAPKSGTGPFQLRIQTVDVTSSKNVETVATPLAEQNTTEIVGTPPVEQNAIMNVNVLVEPDPQLPLVGGPRLEITRAEDDKGRSLRSEEQAPLYERALNVPQPIDLKSPEKDARSIAHLDGKATYVLATKREKWEVPNLLNTKEEGHDFQIGNNKVRVSILSARKIDNDVEIEVAVKAVGGTTNPSSRHPLLDFGQLASAIRLVDAKGQVLDTAGYGGSTGGGELTGRIRYALRRTFRLPPPPQEDGQPLTKPTLATLAEPVKLSMDVPSELVQTQIPFSFSNLPLPQ